MPYECVKVLNSDYEKHNAEMVINQWEPYVVPTKPTNFHCAKLPCKVLENSKSLKKHDNLKNWPKLEDG